MRLWARLAPLPAAPVRLAHLPVEPWPGDSDAGRALIGGTFRFAGQTMRGDEYLWTQAQLSPAWHAALHRFDWLADLRAAGGDAARARARALISGWIAAHPTPVGPGFVPATLGARIANWLSHGEYVLAGTAGDRAGEEFAVAFRASIAFQSAYLARIGWMAPPGIAALLVLKGRLFGALACAAGPESVIRLTGAVNRALAHQLLRDGGHISRSPMIQTAALRHAIDIRAALVGHRYEVPSGITKGISAMAPALRMLRHGDGGLACFNGGREGVAAWLDMVLTQSGERRRAPASLADSYYERLSAGRVLVIADCGAPPPRGFDGAAQAGALSFEMSVGRERLVVNLGAAPEGESWAAAPPAPGRWADACRATAAHSTLVLEDRNSAGLTARGITRRPRAVTSQRREADGAVWLDASHDGYVRRYGLIHTRRLYLAADGASLRGADQLALAPGKRARAPRRFQVRFHLHPAVRASLIQDGTAVLLRLAGGGWRFTFAGGALSLEDSVYLGAGRDARRTRQIVIHGETKDGAAEIKWAFSRVKD